MAPLLGDLIKGGGLGGHIFISVGGFKEARGGWVVIFGQRPKIYTFPSGIFLTPPGLSQHLMQACCPNISCCPNIPILLSQHLSLAVQHLSLAVPTSHAGLLESSSPLAGSPKDKVREVSGMKHRNQEELRKHKETCLPFTIWLIESSSLARIPQG